MSRGRGGIVGSGMGGVLADIVGEVTKDARAFEDRVESVGARIDVPRQHDATCFGQEVRRLDRCARVAQRDVGDRRLGHVPTA